MNIPWTTVVVFAVTTAAIVILALAGQVTNLPIFISILPGILTSTYFAEKGSKQTSNGNVKSAVKDAIDEHQNGTK